jgi:hypothetical protein
MMTTIIIEDEKTCQITAKKIKKLKVAVDNVALCGGIY